MWVHVTRVKGERLIGTLADDPVLVKHLKHGDTVGLTRQQVEMVVLTPEKWSEEAERLMTKADYSNNRMGKPMVEELFALYSQGLSPWQALKRWRDVILPEKTVMEGELDEGADNDE